MTLPLDLVLVRHGESEGNIAKRRSEQGDHSVFTKEFRNRHTSSFRLSKRGREQASLAGKFLRKEFFRGGSGFDRYITSEYARAMETAGLLRLPQALWFRDFYLAERGWGELEICPEDERVKRFGDALKQRAAQPFFWRPPNGESMAQLCLRVDRVLHTLHRECSDKRVLIVCHGEVMRAFQVRLERMSQGRFKRQIFSKKSEDRIRNCQIIHYTRRDPENGILSPHANWVRWIRPTEEPVPVSDWRQIERPRYTNAELLEVVECSKPMIE